MAKHSRKKAAPWGIRIIGEGVQPAGQFLANPDNWRLHSLQQEAQLNSILSEVGWLQRVTVNRRTHPGFGQHRNEETLVDGHLRVKAALARGEDTPVPCQYVDLSPEEERRALLTLDPLAAMAGHDDDLLAQLSTQAETEWPDSEFDLDVLLPKRQKKKAKGLTHEVHECVCCKAGCHPDCGCYREA